MGGQNEPSVVFPKYLRNRLYNKIFTIATLRIDKMNPQWFSLINSATHTAFSTKLSISKLRVDTLKNILTFSKSLQISGEEGLKIRVNWRN